MKRTFSFVKKIGTVSFSTSSGQEIEIPLFPGILKHLSVNQLPKVLSNESVVQKYTYEALKTAPWPVLKEFPQSWLKACIEGANIRPERRRALEFLLR